MYREQYKCIRDNAGNKAVRIEAEFEVDIGG